MACGNPASILLFIFINQFTRSYSYALFAHWPIEPISPISHDVVWKFMKVLNSSSNCSTCYENVLFSPSTLVQLYGMVYAVASGQVAQEIDDEIFMGWKNYTITDSMYDYNSHLATRINPMPASRKKVRSDFLTGNKIFFETGWTSSQLSDLKLLSNTMYDIAGL